MKKIEIIITAVVILICVSLIGFGIANKPNLREKTLNVNAAKLPKIKYDTVLLKKFEVMATSLNFNKKSFCYAGKFNVADGKDTTHNLHDLAFLFCRKGLNFYSRLGKTETINENGVNIYISHYQKKVVVSNEDYKISAAMTNIDQLLKIARSENYALVTYSVSSLKTIALLNEHHITCKEIAVTYDTLSNKLKDVTMRFSDFNNVLNKKTERKVSIGIDKTSDDPDMNNYPGVKDIVKEKGGKLVLSSRFATYELITL